jgi:PPK2 family polyphosphate:nucleotide phosphotransferase
MNIEKLRVGPHRNFSLRKRAADDTFGISKSRAEKDLKGHIERLAALHDLLYAENKRALLIVLQGMDAAGKDGTIKHVMSGVNPQGCSVTSFKEPSPQELQHDYLWRIHAAVPGRGSIGIFNRSHYEDVLTVRVHNIVPKTVWSKRYGQINSFETILAENDVHMLKLFLHIDSDEQQKRFEERLEDPRKNWKASPADFHERKYWDEYQQAYEDALLKCDTAAAPWYVIPSNHKWFRNYAVASIVIEALESFHMKYPKVDKKRLAAIREA